MRTVLENIRTLIAELVGLIGGLIWASNTNWDYEPVILITVSAIGICTFTLLRFFPPHDDRPNVVFEFVSKSTFRSPPDIIANMSPKDETGQYFVIEQGGMYLFRVKKRFDLIIRNNSKNNAYNLTLYKIKQSYPLLFEKKYNPLEPLVVDKPITLPFTYEVYRPMTHQDAEILLNSDLPEDLKNLVLIAEYKSESHRKYYTKFSPMANNTYLNNFSQLDHFEKI